MSDLKEKEAIKTLEKLGYKVKLSKPTIKKTFEVEVEILDRFIEIQKSLGFKMKEAMSEAMTEWIKKRG